MVNSPLLVPLRGRHSRAVLNCKAISDGSDGKLKMIGEPLQAEEFGFIFPKGSDLVAPVNAGIAALKADGTLDKITQKWFVDYKP